MTLGESSAPERNCCMRDTQNIERVLFALSPGFLGEIISDFLSLLHQLIGVAAHIFYFFLNCIYLFYGSSNLQGKHLLPARVNIKKLPNSFISTAVL